jgi:hypothetical protein
MKTDDLIAALSRDATLSGPGLRPRLALAFAGAVAIAATLLMMVIKPRPDLAVAATTMLFDLKMVLLATLVIAAGALLTAAARPEAEVPKVVLMLPIGLLVFGLGHEIATQPQTAYVARLFGRNWAFCLVAIPLMAVGPLGLMLAALRNTAAPSNPAFAGAMAGVAGGMVAAFFYGLHCVDDSPFFVVTWYTLAIGLMAVIGAAIGRRLLAW